MPIDFFENECHVNINHKRFGLCDDVDLPGEIPTPAYIKPYEEEDWIATVTNNNNLEIKFTAIDHCVIKDQQDDGTERQQACDCMLQYNSALLFIELKDRTTRGWQEVAMNQLFETIKTFKALYTLDNYTVRKAYLSNKARPQFPFFIGIEKDRFEDNTGFDLVIETNIVVSYHQLLRE